MPKQEQYVDSRVLHDLIQAPAIDGYGLAATYAILLSSRNRGHCFAYHQNSNNKFTKGYRMLALHSGLSMHTLKKYVPRLVEMGLCRFTRNGSLLMRGRRSLGTRKSIRIQLGNNLAEVKTFIKGIPVLANIRAQRSMSDKKVTLKIIISKVKRDIPLTKRELKIYKAAQKNPRLDLENLNKVENTILSNKRISELVTYNQSQSPSLGTYYRKKFHQNGQMVSRRRYKRVIDHRMSHGEFMNIRKSLYDNYGFVTYRKGYVVRPIASEVAIPHDLLPSYNTLTIIDYIESRYSCEGDAEATASLT